MSIPAPELTQGYQDDRGLWVFTRTEFGRYRFMYNPGEHVVFGGPSTRGKTTLAFDLLEYVTTTNLPGLVAVSKPDDKTTLAKGTALGFRRVDEWPPPLKVREMFDGKPRGYLVWPKMGNIHTDVTECARITRDLMERTYANGVKHKHAILVMDDTMVKAKVMGLDGDMVTILAMAGAMGIGLWIFVQKPTDSGRTTLWGYENATHLFFTKGGDSRMLARYVEIAGDQGQLVRNIVPTLKPFQFLYVQKYEGWVCIVDAA